MPDITDMAERKCAPAGNTGGQPRAACNITYITKGAAQYRVNGSLYQLKAGDLFCPPPDGIFEAITCPDNFMHCFSVDFYLRNAAGENVSLPFPVVNYIGVRGDITGRFLDLKNAWTERSPAHAVKARGMFLLLLYQLFELIVYDSDLEAEDSRVRKAVRYIDDHYAEKISVKQLAGEACLSAVYFGSLFKKETGISLHRYLQKVRIRNAENLLKTGEYQVCEVAEECGFADAYHFSHQFKSIKGFSPSKCLPARNFS
ncbi:MAG: AraC family transcriptional regulator [Treponema sp.]|nr:AraC family transcriptional regulator [Treponema sp.]